MQAGACCTAEAMLDKPLIALMLTAIFFFCILQSFGPDHLAFSSQHDVALVQHVSFFETPVAR